MKYKSKFRLSRYSRKTKNWFISLLRGDVPDFVVEDVKKRFDKGERIINIPMVSGGGDKSLINYLNEFHDTSSYGWNLPFLHKAFDYMVDRLQMKFSYSDIQIEVFDMSDTDKRVTITYND